MLYKKLVSSTGTVYIYEIKNMIGSGSTAEVYMGLNEKTGETVAIKAIYRQRVGERCIMEAKIHKEINDNPHVLKLLEVLQTANHLYMITEFCEGGTLRKLLNSREGKRLTEKEAVEYFSAMADALSALHKKGYMHRDIKPENMLLKDGKLKLADFGSGAPETEYESVFGTREYLAPEIMDPTEGRTYNKQVDIWALGVVFHEMLYGVKPYEGNSEKQIFESIIARPYRATEEDSYVSKEARDLLNQMLVNDPRKRITIEEIKEHPLFTGEDSYVLVEKLKDLLEDESQGEYFRSLMKQNKFEMFLEQSNGDANFRNGDLSELVMVIDERMLQKNFQGNLV